MAELEYNSVRRCLAGAVLLLATSGFPGGAGLAQTPGEMVFQRQEGEASSDAFPPAVFPHWIHRVRYRCYVCHEALFKMKQGANPATMDEINEGQSCGACHNGAVAFAPNFGNCGTCHVEKAQ